MDEAVSSKIMTSVISLLDGKIPSDSEDLATTIETILGEDRADACKKLIKACEIRKANSN